MSLLLASGVSRALALQSSLVSVAFNPASGLVTGQPLVFIATVDPATGSGVTPTGQLTFTLWSGGVTFNFFAQLDTGGGAADQAVTTYPGGLYGGIYSVAVSYSGDPTYAGSAVTTSLAVSPTAIDLLLALPTPGPYQAGGFTQASVTLVGQTPGQSFIYPSRSVSLYGNGSFMGSGSLNNVYGTNYYYSTVPVIFPSGGPQTLSAYYPGDAYYQTASSPSLVVNANPTTCQMYLSAYPTPTSYGSGPTGMQWIANLQNGSFSLNTTPSGTVYFYDGTSLVGSSQAVSGSSNSSTAFLALNLPAGTHSLVATYSGDTNYQGRSVTISQTVSKAFSSVFFTAPANLGSAYGVPVTFQAQVNSPGIYGPVSWTGPVSLFDSQDGFLGAKTLGVGAPAVTWVFSSLSVGSHLVTALYPGDGNYLPSTITNSGYTVSKASASASATLSTGPYYYGETVSLGASVTALSGSLGVPTGGVAFYDTASGYLGTAPLSGGSGALSTRFLTLGAHSVTFDYVGDPNFTADTGSHSALGLTVQKEPTTLLLTSPVNPLTGGASAFLSATVGAADAAYGASAVPSGAVTFVDSTTSSVLGTAFLQGGTASLTAPLSAAGTHVLTAYYTGDPYFAASGPASLSQVVIASTPTVTPTPSPTGTPTVSPTPTATYNRSPIGRLSLGPNLVKNGEPICLFLDKPVSGSTWDIYTMAGERVTHLSFGPGKACWDHAGIASGFYFIRVQAYYLDGTGADSTFKAVILR